MLRGLDPLLHALLNYSMLFLAKEHAKLSAEQQRELGRCLEEAQGRLAPLDQVLELPRKELLEDAKLRVPVWQRYPLFKKLVNWLRGLFSGPAPEAERRGRRNEARPAAAAPKAPGAGRRAPCGREGGAGHHRGQPGQRPAAGRLPQRGAEPEGAVRRPR